MTKDSVARELNILMNKVKRKADTTVSPDVRCQVTEVQGRVLGFLYRNRRQDVFQRDVEAEFSITRATASKMLSLMERNELITRSGVVGDARLKKLALTDKAMGYTLQIEKGMRAFEQTLTRNLTEAERQELLRLLHKVEKNVE